ncbi:GNAT family N-acetyltransferase [Streptomyces sp. NPDC051133]|uniref:GNAT family N-acetyltransferase n=1 Tax=Streptomyces sp. NPDC051133 TaxID=3155521 RepID=UPI003441ED2F
MRPENWHLTEDLDDFLARAGRFLRSRPALHTVPLSVTDALRRRGPHVYGERPPLFGTLATPDGTVRATLLHTPPFPLNVTPLTREEADALAARLTDLGHRACGVSAEQDTAEAFAQSWRRRTGAQSAVRQRQRLHRLTELAVPEPRPQGRARVAVPADRDLVGRWCGEFAREAGVGIGTAPAEWADARIAHGGVTLWETPDGTPVSLAAVTRESAGQVRIAPVYTPPALRGHGYAGAVTAEVSRVARDSGVPEILLFTDLANPTSNGLYRRIGYRAVADFTVWEFGD